MSPAEENLREAAVRAFLRGYSVRSLMELESFGGPACGAAGGIVRKWPAEGVRVVIQPEGGTWVINPVIRTPAASTLVLTYVRNGKRSEIHVKEIKS